MKENTSEADVAFIRALAELLRENDLNELEVSRESGKDTRLSVRVSRGGATVAMVPAPAAPAPAAPAAPATPATPAAPAGAAPAQADATSEDPAAHPGAIASPMVGTVYLAPEPGADPFVKVGDKVEEGQTVCIVEAMKTMNQIPAPRAGTVRRILVEDGAPVEYGAPLMIVE